MSQSKTCPKCADKMVTGYIVDKNHVGIEVEKWIEGEPRKSIWVGLKLGGTKPIDIATWRCRRSGC